MQRKEKGPCGFCSKGHCINKDRVTPKKDYSCYAVSTCSNCPVWNYCQNLDLKDRVEEPFVSLKKDEKGIPTCFLKPTCQTCPRGTGSCKNRGSLPFSWNSETRNVSCFSGLHSTR